MDWSISELKERARAVIKANYGWFVLVALILSLVGGSGGSAGGGVGSGMGNTYGSGSSSSTYSTVMDDDDDYDYDYDHGDHPSARDSVKEMLPALAIAGTVFFVVFAVVFAVALAFTAFVTSPLIVGSKRFAMHAREGRTNFNDLFFAFGCGNYMNIVKIMFFRSLKVFGWSLLFIIPGIIKGYEYRMLPYILSENPDIDSKRAFELTKEMTDGEKGRIFLLDLSFIGWNILAVLCCCLFVGILWVTPYFIATEAELYAVLREKALRGNMANMSELCEYYREGYAGPGDVVDGAYHDAYSNENTNSYYGQNGSDAYNAGYIDSQTEEKNDDSL